MVETLSMEQQEFFSPLCALQMLNQSSQVDIRSIISCETHVLPVVCAYDIIAAETSRELFLSPAVYANAEKVEVRVHRVIVPVSPPECIRLWKGDIQVLIGISPGILKSSTAYIIKGVGQSLICGLKYLDLFFKNSDFYHGLSDSYFFDII